MSDNITKRVGLGTAYGFAKAGGYEGTAEEFTELLGNIAIDLARIENLSVTVTTLPAGSQATASLNGSVLSLGIPKGDKGDKGNTGETGAPAGFGTVSATVDDTIGTPSVEVTASGADTAKNFAFAFHNLKGQKGDKGDTGEVSEAELTQAFADFSENGTVANAEQLTTDIKANDQSPYLFRTSGGSVDIGDREYINGIVGGTVAWNQLVYEGDFSTVTAWANSVDYRNVVVDNGRGKIAPASDTAWVQFCTNSVYYDKAQFAKNHKYLFAYELEANIPLTQVWIEIDQNWTRLDQKMKNLPSGTIKTSQYGILNASAEVSEYTYPRIVIVVNGTFVGGSSYCYCDNVQLFDLTQMFGSTIADYIYSLEQANAGAGVAFFKTLFPKPYYAYNAGELMSVKGLVSHDMVGFNAWDEEWESGAISITNGQDVYVDNSIRSKNYNRCVGNTSYFIKSPTPSNYIFWYDANEDFISYDFIGSTATPKTSPADASYFRLRIDSYGTTYNHDICINLSWDGSEDGNYEPYQKWSYPLDSDLELRGIPKIENGNLHYDGDVYESDGTVTRKYGIVDLGTLTWSKISTTGDHWRFYATYDDAKAVTNAVTGNLMCEKYEATTALESYDGQRGVAVQPNGTHTVLMVVDENYSDQTAFKTAMDGVYLVYELATPTEESADPYNGTQIVDDFGTEEFVLSDSVFPVPVGHNTDYPINLKAKVEMMPNSPSGDGDYIVRQTNGVNEYVSIANNATIQDILTRLEALEG